MLARSCIVTKKTHAECFQYFCANSTAQYKYRHTPEILQFMARIGAYAAIFELG